MERFKIQLYTFSSTLSRSEKSSTYRCTHWWRTPLTGKKKSSIHQCAHWWGTSFTDKKKWNLPEKQLPLIKVAKFLKFGKNIKIHLYTPCLTQSGSERSSIHRCAHRWRTLLTDRWLYRTQWGDTCDWERNNERRLGEAPRGLGFAERKKKSNYKKW